MTTDSFLSKLYEWLGPRAVLLPLPLGEKKLVSRAWQSTTFERTQEPDYQEMLTAAIARKGNIAVRLTAGLVSLDIDADAIAENFAAKPRFAETLRSRGQRGCNFWFRITGDYPNGQDVYKLESGGKEIGEWRCGPGAYTVIFGQHPESTPEHPIRYQRIAARPALEIAFTDIADVVLPWLANNGSKQKQPAASVDLNLDKRIAAYIAAIPGAISGNDGHGQTYYAACALWNGWALSIDEAMPYMQTYNLRCEPPWTDKELAHKLDNAEKDPRHEKPRGHLRDARRPGESGNNHSPTPVAPRGPQTTGVENGKPVLLLPCPSVEIEQCARECFPALAKSHRYFTRDRTVFEVVRNSESVRLSELDPAAFRSQLESYFWLGTLRTMPDGKSVACFADK